jgi:hypothetical protein
VRYSLKAVHFGLQRCTLGHPSVEACTLGATLVLGQLGAGGVKHVLQRADALFVGCGIGHFGSPVATMAWQ